MNTQLAALLLREVFLPGNYPYHINISSDKFSNEEIENVCLIWKKKVYFTSGSKKFIQAIPRLPIIAQTSSYV